MTTQAPRTVPWPRLWRAGVLAAVAAAVVNVVVFLLARAAGAMPADVLNPMGQPVGLGSTLLLTLLPPLAAAGLLGLLARLTRRAVPIFLVVAALVFAVMAMSPIGLPGAPAGMIAALELMHLVVAVPAVLLPILALRGA